MEPSDSDDGPPPLVSDSDDPPTIVNDSDSTSTNTSDAETDNTQMRMFLELAAKAIAAKHRNALLVAVSAMASKGKGKSDGKGKCKSDGKGKGKGDEKGRPDADSVL